MILKTAQDIVTVMSDGVEVARAFPASEVKVCALAGDVVVAIRARNVMALSKLVADVRQFRDTVASESGAAQPLLDKFLADVEQVFDDL